MNQRLAIFFRKVPGRIRPEPEAKHCILSRKQRSSIYWQTRGEFLKSRGTPLHWLLVCMNQRLAICFRQVPGRIRPEPEAKHCIFSRKQRSWTPFYSRPNKSWST